VENIPFVPNKNKANVDGRYELEDQFSDSTKEINLTEEEQSLFTNWDYHPETLDYLFKKQIIEEIEENEINKDKEKK